MQSTASDVKVGITLGFLVREALAELDGDVGKAVDRLFYTLKNDRELLRKVVEEAVRLAVYVKSDEANRNSRKSVMRVAAQSAANASRSNVVALSEGIRSCLLDFPLGGGKRLRDATRDEVIVQADKYEKAAFDMSHKARWLRLIIQSVPQGKKVGDVLQERRVQELFEQTRVAAAELSA